MGGPARPPGGGGAAGEDLSRSRGGFITKVHLSADGRCRPLSLVVTPEQRADCTRFEPVVEKIRVPRIGAGRPRSRPNSVSADKAYSNPRTLAYLRKRGIGHIIPEKVDQALNRIKRGSHGGRPPGFDKKWYKQRNVVERAINKLKGFRTVATRYDKRGHAFPGTVTFAIIWLRS
ncbi:IS5 family transposase [Streptomyces mashuensis]|uniref:IS5 family transposase n=1 Tax=Streptomyces mashuensis TaxID=33904 RepID=A0A919AWD5_9ACTN|nr:IS5 family transposase [Streptomyces mashuensis]